MKDQKKGKEKEQVAEPALSLPAARQPSGYSSASFYDLSSLPSLTESTSDPDFECSSSSESIRFSEDTSPAHSEHSSSTLSLASVSSLAHTAKPAVGSSSGSEGQSSAESGPSLEKPSWAASGDTASLRQGSSLRQGLSLEGCVVNSDSPSLSCDGENAAAWPKGLTPSGPASPQNGCSPIVASPASSLASGPSELPQNYGGPGNASHLSSGDESDLEGPVRFVVYSPHITLKDLIGDCRCWKEKKKLL